MINVLFNLIVSFFPWKAEYNRYKIIITFLTQTNMPRASSLNSTRNASKIKKEPEKEESFKKEPTELIFVYTNTDENIMNENEHEHNGEYENEMYISRKHKSDNLNNIKTINNNIQINNIIINNISKNKINNMIDSPNDDNHLKLLKLNKNKKKENDKNINQNVNNDNNSYLLFPNVNN